MNKTTYSGMAFIAREEAVVLVPYKDSVGIDTVGIGHTEKPFPKTPLSLESALDLFEKDLRPREQFVSSKLTVIVSQHEFDALMSLCFNIGNGAFAKSSVLKALNAGNRTLAASNILAWNKVTVNGKKKVSSGLDARRKRERDLFLNANYGNLTKIPVYRGNPASTKSVLMELPKRGVSSSLPPTPSAPAPIGNEAPTTPVPISLPIPVSKVGDKEMPIGDGKLAGQILSAAVSRVLAKDDVPVPAQQVPTVATQITQAIAASPNVAVVEVKSALASKINWAALAMVLASIAAYFGLKIDVDTLNTILVGLTTLGGVIIWVFRTWFTKTVNRK